MKRKLAGSRAEPRWQKRRLTRVLALLMRLLWASVLVPVVGAQAGVVLTTLHSFSVVTNGANPVAELVQGRDGNFYGTTLYGGTKNLGAVFRISTNGALNYLYSFTGGNDGANPDTGLVQTSDGDFYGTTEYGGTSNSGTVFRMRTNGALTSLYSFTGGNDGAIPNGLVQGSDGNFYGTTAGGLGTVFKISTNGVLTSLYSFTGGSHGSAPSGFVQASDGNFYGTTELGGGANQSGTVFQISTKGILTTLYLFTGGSDGANPYAGLVQGNDGYLYGTTLNGGTYGSGTSGYGTVFKIGTNGALTSLYSFTGTNDGANSYTGLVPTSDGNFYGTTAYGGTNGAGTVFRISTNGALSTLYSFSGGSDGAVPKAKLVQSGDGNFYGTTYGGGRYGGGFSGFGTVFRMSPDGALSSLYSFFGGNGFTLANALAQGRDGNFYGTTAYGGTNGAGTAFKISTNGALSTLFSFGVGDDGAIPKAGLVEGNDGNFYGTTAYGGTNSFGTVFKISPTGVLTFLYSFSSTNDGANPNAKLAQGNDGYLYGTTYQGGTNNAGTVFKISTNGALSSLHSFTGLPNDGANPSALVQGSDGNFYGTTYSGGDERDGTVFKISTSGALTSLHSFSAFAGDDTFSPAAALVQGSDGNFYGTTTQFHEYQFGHTFPGVFKISANGVYASLILLEWPATRFSALVQGSDGNFYGSTYGGVPSVFEMTPTGSLTTLVSGLASSALVQGSDGSFYGTTSSGGAGGAGTVFRLTIVPDPQLTLITSGPYVILTWPTSYGAFSYAGYTLQSTTNLGSSAVWSAVSPSPVVISGQNVVVNPILEQQFFRLSQ